MREEALGQQEDTHGERGTLKNGQMVANVRLKCRATHSTVSLVKKRKEKKKRYNNKKCAFTG